MKFTRMAVFSMATLLTTASMAIAGTVQYHYYSPNNPNDNLYYVTDAWVSDGQYPPTYSWQEVGDFVPMTRVDGPYQWLYRGTVTDPIYNVGTLYRIRIFREVAGPDDHLTTGYTNAY